MAGIYRLHCFATSQWIFFVRRCVEKSNHLSAYPDLLELLTRLALERTNYSFDGQVDFKDRVFRTMLPDRPEISQFVCGILQFRQDDKQSDWNYTNSMSRKLQPLDTKAKIIQVKRLTVPSSHINRSHMG